MTNRTPRGPVLVATPELPDDPRDCCRATLGALDGLRRLAGLG